jgi:hypothetical protein
MRAMLFLLIGFAAAVLVGSAFFPSPATLPADDPVAEMTVAQLGGTVPWLCALLAWLTTLLTQPRWLWLAHMVLVTLLGLFYLAGGLLTWMLDAGFNPGSASAGPAYAGAGLLILASRELAVRLRRRAASTEAPA